MSAPAFQPRTLAKLAASQRAGYERALKALRYRSSCTACASLTFLPGTNSVDLANVYQNAELKKAGAFLSLSCDEETSEFMARCYEQYRTCSYTSLVSRFIRPFVAKVLGHADSNGFLGIGQMHLFSTPQCARVLGLEGKEGEAARLGRLLDVGAGDGRITQYLSPLFREVVATEVAPSLVKRLRARGFTAVQTADIAADVERGEGFDVISLLNLIDRCDRPRTLLKDVRRFLRSPNSRVIVATPLPLNPWVEVDKKWVRPSEPIGRRSCCFKWADHTFDDAIRYIVEDYFQPLGYRVVTVSRLPYLSQGDSHRAYYVLDDAIFVLQADPNWHQETWKGHPIFDSGDQARIEGVLSAGSQGHGSGRMYRGTAALEAALAAAGRAPASAPPPTVREEDSPPPLEPREVRQEPATGTGAVGNTQEGMRQRGAPDPADVALS